MALWTRNVSGSFEKRAPAHLILRETLGWASPPNQEGRGGRKMLILCYGSVMPDFFFPVAEALRWKNGFDLSLHDITILTVGKDILVDKFW